MSCRYTTDGWRRSVASDEKKKSCIGCLIYEERAAILEYEAGYSRGDAERIALKMCDRKCGEQMRLAV